jgi:hypothetical protein
MTFNPTSADRLLSIYLALGQYPILSSRIRARMRQELFNRGILNPVELEAEVREKAILSQQQEGLTDPLYEEPTEVWELRMSRVRKQLTDLTFSQHLKFELFEKIVAEVLAEHGVSFNEALLAMNPELAPQELVFQQAMTIERLPGEERARMDARLHESKVVLIRSLISDQLRYINIAKEWFTISDLAEIRRHKIGPGRIGGKAAGMLLAARILQEVADPGLRGCLRTPDSYFIGSDLMYTFMSTNNLVHWNDQKYKDEAQMRADFPMIVQEYSAGAFPPDILDKLQTMLLKIGNKPLIVRSSSLLEDNFGTSFAGKYESIFCPNQGSLEENLKAITNAIARIYASTLNPNALLYRRSKGLQDYDERMALLIQVVEGEPFGDYYLPDAAGVAFSRNLYRWAPQIRSEDGFVRLVWGLGTRAVDRVGNDYPRLIALSHPLLRPSSNANNIRRYSQQYVDLIDLKANVFKTLPVQEVINSDYEPLRYIAQLDEDGYFSSLRSMLVDGENQKLVLTFDDLLKRTNFSERMREMLRLLEFNYRSPVDMEFALHISMDRNRNADVCITILQCRPQSRLQATEQVALPTNLQPDEIVFITHFMVPQGCARGIDYILFVKPETYLALPDHNARAAVARMVGHLNAALADKEFVCVGPGRWGSSNSDLGVPIDYGDVYHSKALIELAGQGYGLPPEPSLGTHFFQDLMEAQIYPLAIFLDDPHSQFNRPYFYDAPNHIREFISVDDAMADCLRLIKVSDLREGCELQIVMNEEKNTAIAYLLPKNGQDFY